MNFLWTEDTGAGFHFWNLLNLYAFDGSLNVESKQSNQGILDAVRELTPNIDDHYYIAFDIVYDNMDVVNKYLELMELSSKHPGQIHILDMICFEHFILTFHNLVKWTGCNRQDKIRIREVLLGVITEHQIDLDAIEDEETLHYLMGFKRYSTERVLKSITYEMTDNDTWSVKGNFLGICWFKDCCAKKIEEPDKRRCGCKRDLSGSEKFMKLITESMAEHTVKEIVRDSNCSFSSAPS